MTGVSSTIRTKGCDGGAGGGLSEDWARGLGKAQGVAEAEAPGGGVWLILGQEKTKASPVKTWGKNIRAEGTANPGVLRYTELPDQETQGALWGSS